MLRQLPEEPLQPPAPPPADDQAADTAGLTPPPPPQEVTPEESAEAAAGGTEAETDAADTGSVAPGEAQPSAPETVPAAPAAEAPEPAAEPAPAAAPEAEPEPTPQVAAAGAGFRIQLAAVKSEADAKAEWARLQKAHADLLGDLAPTIQRADLGAQGIFYRIQGGPLPSDDAARALCDKLEAKKQACLVVKP